MSLFAELGRLQRGIVRLMTKTTSIEEVQGLMTQYVDAENERNRIRRKRLDKADQVYVKAIAGVESATDELKAALDDLGSVARTIAAVAAAVALVTKVPI